MSASKNSAYNQEEKEILLDTARHSIEHGLKYGNSLQVEANNYSTALQAKRACFVTINKKGELRGCIGALVAQRALIIDVSENAFLAAFRDPRFPPVSDQELEQLELHISVLSPPEPMTFSDEADLISQIRPDVDGLILEAGNHRGTFLPSVWESLKTPEDFLRQLKRKAGLAESYWSNDISMSRYTAEYI